MTGKVFESSSSGVRYPCVFSACLLDLMRRFSGHVPSSEICSNLSRIEARTIAEVVRRCWPSIKTYSFLNRSLSRPMYVTVAPKK